MRGLKGLTIVVLGLGTLALGAPAVAGAAPAAPGAPAQSGPLPGPLVWTPCPLLPPPPTEDEPPPLLPMECATLPVPLDHDQPRGRQLALALFRLPAADAAGRVGSLVLNPGGPGVPTQEFLAGLSQGVPPPLAARYDLVTFDTRGTGASEGLACNGPEAGLTATGNPFADQEAFGRALGMQCLAEDADLVARMSSTDIARDLDLVRAGLGEERLHYVGFSWGTLLGALYAELHPSRVGRMVLDGAIDPNASYLEIARRTTLGAEVVLNSFFARCDADPGCALQPYGTGAVWRHLAWKAGDEGLGAPDGRRLQRDGFLIATYAALSAGRPVFPIFAQYLLEAAQGDATSLIEVAERYAAIGTAGSFYATNCADDSRRHTAEEVQLEAAGLLDRAPNLYVLVVEVLGCAGFPASPTVRPTVAVGAGEVPPVLVIGNTADPATPYENAVALAAALGGSVLLTFEGEGHTVAFQGVPCVDDAVVAHLVGGVLPPTATVCQPPPGPNGVGPTRPPAAGPPPP